jgi:small subunit ribosomal protein S6
MVRDYELMYIVRPDVDEDGLRAAVESVKTLIEGQGGEIRKTTNWGKRRLAYEVKHLRDGHYVIVEMRLDGARVAEVERALRIHDAVFRHLLVIQEEPSADTDEEGEDGAAADALLPSPDADVPGDGEQAAAAAGQEPEPQPDTETTAGADEDEDVPAAELEPATTRRASGDEEE